MVWGSTNSSKFSHAVASPGCEAGRIRFLVKMGMEIRLQPGIR